MADRRSVSNADTDLDISKYPFRYELYFCLKSRVLTG